MGGELLSWLLQSNLEVDPRRSYNLGRGPWRSTDLIAIACAAAELVFSARGVSSHPASKDGDPSKRCRDLSQAARGEPACAFHDVVQLISGLGAPPTPNGSPFVPTRRNRCISRRSDENGGEGEQCSIRSTKQKARSSVPLAGSAPRRL